MKINKKVFVKFWQANLAEIYGNDAMVYAVLNEKYEQICSAVRCKDFITDLFWAKNTGNDVSIYNFIYKPAKDSIEKQDRYFIAIRCQDKEIFTNVDNIIGLLHKFELGLGFSPSLAEEANNGRAITFSFDKRWADKPYLMSLYTLLLRVGYDYNTKLDVEGYLKDYKASKVLNNNNDYSYVKSSLQLMLDTLNGKTYKQLYKNYDLSSCHATSGIASFKPKETIKK